MACSIEVRENASNPQSVITVRDIVRPAIAVRRTENHEIGKVVRETHPTV
jgi:hypothetical protein